MHAKLCGELSFDCGHPSSSLAGGLTTSGIPMMGSRSAPKPRRAYDDGHNTARKLSKSKLPVKTSSSSTNLKKSLSADKTQTKGEDEPHPKMHDKQTRSRRSSSKSAKLSERWTVLTKIMRVQRASIEAEVENDSNNSGNESSSDEDDNNESASRQSAGRTSPERCEDEHQQHAHSPKIPSPLTGIPSALYTDPPRYHYGNHGLSHSSLCHKRHLWARRKHAWDEYEHHMDAWRAVVCAEAAAYGGIVYPDVPLCEPQPPPAQSRRRTDLVSEATLPPTCLSPVPVQAENRSAATYPRLGDLSSLRDPFLLSVDRWFSDLPLWTLSKLTWLYDVNHRLACDAPSSFFESKIKDSLLQEAPEDISVEHDALPDVSVCSTETASSDVTLVNIALKEQPLSPGDNMEESPQETVYWTPVMTPSEDTHHQMGATTSETRTSTRSWEVSWFSRWEVLYHQLRLATAFTTDSDFQDSPSFELIKEASRVLLTSGRVLYNPDAEHYVEYESEDSSETSSREVEVNTEEDPGGVFQDPPAGDSWSKSEANVETLVTFAMAKLPFGDDSIICDTEDCSKDAGAFSSSEHDCNLIHPLESLTLRC